MRPSRFHRLLEALSQVLCVLLVNGDADEMLSSWAYRNDSWMVPWINRLFFDADHCQEAYLWEASHYDRTRFAKETI